jgi:hypothetical protein
VVVALAEGAGEAIERVAAGRAGARFLPDPLAQLYERTGILPRRGQPEKAMDLDPANNAPYVALGSFTQGGSA